jgi:DNA-binding CsgD family transcriptional regulator
MNTGKKQLLIISDQSRFINDLTEELSLHFEINSVNSMHSGYQTAINLLPDLILIDQISIKANNFKNLSNFKSTHFLNKCWLMMYAEDSAKKELKRKFEESIDEFIFNAESVQELSRRIINRIYATSPLTNYWKDAFFGLFNLLPYPVVLLQQDNILAMNDDFKQTFRLDKCEGLKLTDFVNCDNKVKVKASLRNFARGKHMKAVTNTTLRLRDDKYRNAKIIFSKLDKINHGHYIMMINFSEDRNLIKQEIGSNSEMVESCFATDDIQEAFHFTKREKEIIQLLCKGYKTKEISDALFISPKTIEKHRANIIKRTNSETILESIIYAINHNLIDLKMT